MIRTVPCIRPVLGATLAALLGVASLHAMAADSAIPAFPGAMGWAAQTPGGRGGRIIKVTTLAPTGPGSLREALDAKGPRIVVFEVGGVIDLGVGLGRDEGPGDPSGRKRVSHATFADVSGQTRTLAEFGGKVVLIDVWATWCPPCRKSLPEVASLQKRGGEDFVVLAVSVDKGGWGDVTP
ncbi:MAG TPA: TlpA disulfide reductase family protein, partial [Thermomonas sp.]|nr:TlpA disulfide reductase family protein [Thermomonas sp.]